MQGFPRTWRTPNGELYVVLKAHPGVKSLATAYGEDTKADQMVIWTNTYGKARVFSTTLGHFNEEMLAPEWLGATARGLLWCVDKLQDDGTPAEGYAGTGVKPFSFQKDEGKEPTPADKNPVDKPAEKKEKKQSRSKSRNFETFVALNADDDKIDWASTVKFPEKEKPVKLFNGKDLTGWIGHKEKYFNVVDGVIVAKNTAEDAPKVSTYLLTEKKYRNFRLVFEGKLVQSQMHSGIAIWGKQHEVDGEKISYQGHLVMFPTHWGFWDLYRRNSIYNDDGRAKKADNVGGWNKMEILAIGDRIRLAVNGQLVADWKDPKPELCGEGPLGLQLHSNSVPQEVHFRGLVLSQDPEDRMITVAEK
jgi:hypothetical protein